MLGVTADEVRRELTGLISGAQPAVFVQVDKNNGKPGKPVEVPAAVPPRPSGSVKKPIPKKR